MESSKLISTDKPTVVIEVNPQVIQDTVIFVDGHEAGGNNIALKGFLKAQPKALGVMHLMIHYKICFWECFISFLLDHCIQTHILCPHE